MDKEIKEFNNSQFGNLEILIVDGIEYFPATDSAKMLGYSNPQKAIRDHCKGVNEMVTPTKGGQQKKNYITEGNLYRLIINSKLPTAEKFESWVFDEVLPSIRKTGGYVGNDDLFINTYLPFADDSTKKLFKGTLETVRKQNEIIALQNETIKNQKDDIEHKEDVIVGLVDEISLAEKRQILNRVVRYKGANYQQRWRELYKQFEMKYHLDLNKRFEGYNANHKPKMKNKIDYIDRVMNKIPELYEIACKLYENDVKELAKDLYMIA